jgi:hypothetical protein
MKKAIKEFMIDLAQATICASCIGLPFVLYFAFVMKP